MADFNEYWQKRVQEDDFRANVNQLAKEGLGQFLDMNIGEIVDDLSAGVEQADQKTMAEIGGQVYSALIINGTPIVKDLTEETNKAINERVGADALAAWREVVSQPVDLPPETVKAVVQQPAIKELFVNIIHDSIIGFNKKFNPLAGAMAVMGIDKQIREFLVPFMDEVTKLATDFMVDGKNKTMFQDFAAKVFDIVIAEKPAKYMGMPIENSSKLIATAVDKTLNDGTFQQESKESSLKLLAKIKEKYGSQSVRDYMKDNGIKDPTRDLTKWELDIAAKHLAKPAFASFIEKEIQKHG